MKLTKDERTALRSYEDGEWESSKDMGSDRKKMRLYAKNALRKDKRVIIRISVNDLLELQKRAIRDGLPYQALISSVLHRFVNGRLVDKAAEG